MRVFISSESPIKHVAVKRAFTRIGFDVETVGFNVESKVAAQPISIEETYEGAKNRHAELHRMVREKPDYFVTIESGVIKPFASSPWKGCEVVIIERCLDGLTMMGSDLGVEYPQEMLDKVPAKYPDLGVLMQVEYGYAEKDPPSFLTGGRISRADLIEQALFKVLAQMQEKSI